MARMDEEREREWSQGFSSDEESNDWFNDNDNDSNNNQTEADDDW